MQKILLSVLFGLLLGCNNKDNPNTLTIGTISGPETALAEAARDVAKDKYGLNVKIVEFTDYNLPNEALNDKSLDANVYQHLPYLKAAMATHGYQLEAIGKTFIYPMAIYSQKHKKLTELTDNDIVAIPNDPSNENRALLLLQKAGLITLDNNEASSVHGIKDNPHHLDFKEMDAAQLPRILPDVDVAVINTTFAIPAGLSPSKDALLQEDKDSPYANIIVIRQNTDKKKALDEFVKAFNSKPVEEKAKALFGDAAIPAW